MNLEAASSYLLALGVPLWLVGEYVVHTWRASRPSAIKGAARVKNRKVARPKPLSGFESYRRSA
jgi:hypothetical protein